MPQAAPKTVDQLRRGTRIHSLCYAAHLAKNPPRLYDVTWNGLLYQRASATGARGMVGFAKVGAIGLFFDPEAKPAKLDEHLKGAPPALVAHLRREWDGVMDQVTAAFWSDAKGEITGARPWPKLVKDGAHLVAADVEKPERAVKVLAEEYALSADQAGAVLRVFGSQVKLVPAAVRVTISREDQNALGIVMNQATRELLAGAGIELA